VFRDDAASEEAAEHLLEKALGATILEGAGRLYFRHQLLQEYFAARALSARLDELSAAKFWPPDRWWERNNREVTAVLMAGLHSGDCTKVVQWLAGAQPEVAAQCIDEGGATVPQELLDRLHAAWSPRLAGPASDPQPEARAAIGRALGRLNLDRRPGVGLRPDGLPDIALVKIPGGRFLYGEKKKPRSVETFWIARYPVTYAQYRAFLEAEDGYRKDDWWAGLDVTESDRVPAAPRWSEANCPRETVNWFEAMAFCAWLTHRLTQLHGRKIEVRLPTEWEWERSARGTEGRDFPWGNKYVDGYANIVTDSHSIGRISAVGIYPDGAARELGDSGNGIHDLAGNVWEWCLNRWEPATHTERGGRESRVVRGGAWDVSRDLARAVYRFNIYPDLRNYFLGFRVVCSSPIPAEH
jgi:formylglycine-generating enzyme required for sulfatase activity